MTQAGIHAGDPVLLVGHSQGGMAAAALLSRGSDFHVSNVVTAGSPTAQVDGFPTGSHVLSLEHSGDVVPLTDGSPNPDSREQVTVTFVEESAGLTDSHSYGHYLSGAAAVDASADPSTVEQLASLRDHGFLSGPGSGAPTISSQVFQIVREPVDTVAPEFRCLLGREHDDRPHDSQEGGHVRRDASVAVHDRLPGNRGVGRRAPGRAGGDFGGPRC